MRSEVFDNFTCLVLKNENLVDLTYEHTQMRAFGESKYCASDGDNKKTFFVYIELYFKYFDIVFFFIDTSTRQNNISCFNISM